MLKKFVCLLMFVFISINAIADSETILSENTEISNGCIVDNIGVYADVADMEPVFENNIYTCEAGYYLPKNTEVCEKCLSDNYCTGGDYIYDTVEDQGITHCSEGLVAPAGMYESGQCGRRLHLGDAYVYLRSDKKTKPSLNIDVNKDGIPDFFGSMTKIRVPMNSDVANSGSYNKLVIEIPVDYTAKDGTVISAGKYYVYDDTVNIEEYSM